MEMMHKVEIVTTRVYEIVEEDGRAVRIFSPRGDFKWAATEAVTSQVQNILKEGGFEPHSPYKRKPDLWF